MKTIWKFPLSNADRQKIELPGGAAFLSIGIDHVGARCLWFAVDPTMPKYPFEVIKVGTGWDLPHVGDFLGIIIEDGFVWHYFSGPANSANRLAGFHYQTNGN